MRLMIGLLALAALVLLVVSTSPDETPTQSTVPVISEPVTTEARIVRELRVVASLPDGTEFVVTVEPPMADDWRESTGTIVMDIDGVPTSVGRVSFRNQPNTESSYDLGRYLIPAAGYLGEVIFGEHALAALGPDAEEVITSSIHAGSESGFPVLTLDEPFRWATDEESPAKMAVRFSTFEVRRGCSDLAAVCSPEGDLQVIWRVPEIISAPPSVFPEVSIELVP